MTKNKNKNRKISIKPRNIKKTKKNVQEDLSLLGKAFRTLGSLGGGAIGGLFGAPQYGSSVGSSIGASISKFLGSGDYTVRSNSILQRAANTVPAMHNTGQSVIVRHKEFLGTVTGATAFTVTNTFPINPGMPSTFPWLSQIASRFQEYTIKGMVYCFIPTSGAAVSSSSAALGSVMFQTSYRSNDNAPTSKIEMMNEYWSSETVPFEEVCHAIECDPKENPFNVQYVRNGAVPSGDSQLMYDLGTTFVAVQGQQSAYILGDIWVTYEIELRKPVISSNATDSRYIGWYYTGGSPSGTNLFSTTATTLNTGNITATGAVNTITIEAGNPGSYLIILAVVASTTFSAVDLSGNPTVSNCTVQALSPLTGTYFRNVLGGGTPTLNQAIRFESITITDPALPATIVYPSVTITGTISYVSWTMVPVPTF